MSPTPISRERGYEVSDVSVRAVLLAVALIVGGTVATLGVIHVMMRGPDNTPAAFGVAGPAASFTHGAHERTNIAQSWDELERDLAETTGVYGWVDREAGTVRIPLERAMELIVEEHGDEGGEP